MELFTIGDSVSQGFMSLAAARGDLCYSTLLANALGVKNYEPVSYPNGGLLVPVEDALRALELEYGSNIRGPLEWPQALIEVNRVFDKSEDYYERGAGRESVPNFPAPKAGHYANVASYGFTVADAWQVTGDLCLAHISNANRKTFLKDGFGSIANASFYRSAQRVLDPTGMNRNMTQLDWLNEHATTGNGLKRTCLWLGANNALGTVVELEVRQTPNDPDQRPHLMTHDARDKANWNLWHPTDFALEFDALMDRVDETMRSNKDEGWRVFIGTVPEVTIAPIAKGVGEWRQIDGKYWYAKYYTYFPFEEEFAKESGMHLTLDEALHIDRVIGAYNTHIHERVKQLNKDVHKNISRYVVVDIANTLRELAHKRNGGYPTYTFPESIKYRYPPVNTKYYHADVKGRLRQGGLVSLDGIHPSAIGQGLIANEFLAAMRFAGVGNSIAPPNAPAELNWDEIFESDTLYQTPIKLMQEVYQHERLANWIVNGIKMMRD